MATKTRRGTEEAEEPQAQAIEEGEATLAPEAAKRRGKAKRGQLAIGKRKLTLALPDDMVTFICDASTRLRVEPCVVVEKLIRPQMKGYRQAALPPGLLSMGIESEALAS